MILEVTVEIRDSKKYFITYFGQYILEILRVKIFDCPSRCATHEVCWPHLRNLFMAMSALQR